MKSTLSNKFVGARKQFGAVRKIMASDNSPMTWFCPEIFKDLS